MTRPGKNDTEMGQDKPSYSLAEANLEPSSSQASEIQSPVFSKLDRRYKPPYLQWYIREFWSSWSVIQMTKMQRYCYRNLLERAWDADTVPFLPNDDEQLWRLADCDSLEHWLNEIKPVVINRFEATIDGKWIVNVRQYFDYSELVEKHDAQVAGGKNKGKHKLSSSLPTAKHELSSSSAKAKLTYSDSDSDSESDKNKAARKSAKPKATPTPPPFDGAEFCERVATKYPRDVKTAAGQIPAFLATLVMDEVCKWADISQGAEYLEKHVDEFAAWYKRLDTKKRAFIPGFEKFIREGIYKRGEDYWTEKIAGGSEFVDSKPITKVLRAGGTSDEEWEERRKLIEREREEDRLAQAQTKA
jgi:hypothetical protein